MGAPSASLASLRSELSPSFEEFNAAADRQGFIGTRVLPVLSVEKQSGPFGRLTVENILHASATERAVGAGYSRSKWEFGKDSYATVEHGHEEIVDDRESAMYSSYFDHEQISAMRALDVILRNAEKRIAAAVFNTTTWTGSALTTAVGTAWSVKATADPRADVKAAMIKVRQNSGLMANTLIVSWEVFQNIIDAVNVIDRLKFAGFKDPDAGNMTPPVVAQALGIEEVIVAGAVKNTATQGQTAAMTDIWSSSDAMVCRIARTNDPREAGIGRTLHWSESGGGGGVGAEAFTVVESYRDETIRSDVIRVRHDVDEKIMLVEAGHLLTGV